MKYKVKVIKASLPSYWYANHVGEVFKVEDKGVNKDFYTLCQSQTNDEYYLLKSDVKIIG